MNEMNKTRYRAEWVTGSGQQPEGEFHYDLVEFESKFFTDRKQAQEHVYKNNLHEQGKVYVEEAHREYAILDDEEVSWIEWDEVEVDYIGEDGSVETEPLEW